MGLMAKVRSCHIILITIIKTSSYHPRLTLQVLFGPLTLLKNFLCFISSQQPSVSFLTMSKEFLYPKLYKDVSINKICQRLKVAKSLNQEHFIININTYLQQIHQNGYYLTQLFSSPCNRIRLKRNNAATII